MFSSNLIRLLSACAILSASLTATAPLHAEPHNVGYKKCQKCHEPEVDVWKDTAHFKSYKSVHKKKEAKKILKAAGDARSMKKSEVCATCHYTAIGKKQKIKAGPSCESCHGPASEWLHSHNDYGDADDAKDEPADHKAKRVADAKAVGMIWPSMKYDIAENCMSCHGLAKPDINGDTLAAMLDAGHPIEPDFELVAYSQGSVRHRFYPPNVDTNAEMTAAETAELFAIGQMAKLVSATGAANKSSHETYKAAQSERAKDAKAALAPLSGIGAVKAFLAAPDEAKARAAVDAIKGQDLSSKLKLPAKSSYK